MRNQKTIKILLLSLFIMLISSPPGLGRNNPGNRAFSDSLYKEIKKERTYQNFLVKEKKNENFLKQLRTYFIQWLSRIFGTKAARIILSILPYALIILALVLIILRVTNVEVSKILKPNIKTTEGEVSFHDENIHEIDLDTLLKKAEEKKDFRLALRYLYLKVLRLLSINNHIKWQIHKSNYEYKRELSEKSYYSLFAQLTRDFEYLWYGEFIVSDSYYYSAANKAWELIENINKSGKRRS